MQSVEMYFNDTITQHDLFRQAATSLIQAAPSLSPIDIVYRCETLATMHRGLTENYEQLSILIEFVGPGILDTFYIGEFQRALAQSISVCDNLYAEILAYKHNLLSHH